MTGQTRKWRQMQRTDGSKLSVQRHRFIGDLRVVYKRFISATASIFGIFCVNFYGQKCTKFLPERAKICPETKFLPMPAKPYKSTLPGFFRAEIHFFTKIYAHEPNFSPQSHNNLKHFAYYNLKAAVKCRILHIIA